MSKRPVEFKPHFVVRSIESERVPRPSTGNPEKDREFSDMFVRKIIAILDASQPVDRLEVCKPEEEVR